MVWLLCLAYGARGLAVSVPPSVFCKLGLAVAVAPGG